MSDIDSRPITHLVDTKVNSEYTLCCDVPLALLRAAEGRTSEFGSVTCPRRPVDAPTNPRPDPGQVHLVREEPGRVTITRCCHFASDQLPDNSMLTNDVNLVTCTHPRTPCFICQDPTDHHGVPHSEATGDGRVRSDVCRHEEGLPCSNCAIGLDADGRTKNGHCYFCGARYGWGHEDDCERPPAKWRGYEPHQVIFDEIALRERGTTVQAAAPRPLVTPLAWVFIVFIARRWLRRRHAARR